MGGLSCSQCCQTQLKVSLDLKGFQLNASAVESLAESLACARDFLEAAATADKLSMVTDIAKASISFLLALMH